MERKQSERKGEGWGSVAAEAFVGFALRVVALLIVAGALFALIAAASLAQPIWLGPVEEEQQQLIPSPWSGESGA
jgi:hypothetical protein